MKHVVLDLDHTLITSLTSREYNSLAARGKAPSPALKYHRFDNYVIYERPMLGDFLRSLRDYKVSVWTAASKDYGEFIVRNIVEPYMGRPVYLFFHAGHCDFSMQEFGLLKHLDLLHTLPGKSFSRKNTLIVDDNPGILAQNNAVLHIEKFDLNPRDAELAKIRRRINE